MARDELEVWIKKEEYLGYKEKDLIETLKKNGYNKIQIEDALSDIHNSYFSLRNFIASINPIVWLLFIISSVILFFLNFSAGLALIITLASTTMFVEIFKKSIFLRNHNYLSRLIIVFSSLSYFFHALLILNYIQIILSATLMLISIILFFSKKSNPFRRYFLVIIALVMTSAFTYILFLIIDLLAAWFLPFNVLILLFIFFIIVFSFTLIFNLINDSLKKKLLNENLNAKKAIVYGISISLFLSLIVAGYFFVAYYRQVNEFFDVRTGFNSDLTNSFQSSNIETYIEILIDRGFQEENIKVIPIKNYNDEIETFDKLSFRNKNLYLTEEEIQIFFHCTLKLECINVTKPAEKNLNEVMSLEDENYRGLVAIKNDSVIMYLLEENMLKQRISSYYIDSQYEEIVEYQIAKELINENEDLSNSLKKHITVNRPENFKEWITYLINLKYIDDLTENAVYISNKGLRLSYLRNTEEALIQSAKEVGYFKNLPVEDKHLRQLEQDIEYYFSNAEDLTSKSQVPLINYQIQQQKYFSQYLEKYLNKFAEDLQSRLDEQRKEYEIAHQDFETAKQIDESKESKLLRYYVLKYLLSQKVAESNFCRSNKDSCIEWAKHMHAPKICERFYEEETVIDCLDVSINPPQGYVFEQYPVKEFMITEENFTFPRNKDYVGFLIINNPSEFSRRYSIEIEKNYLCPLIYYVDEKSINPGEKRVIPLFLRVRHQSGSCKMNLKLKRNGEEVISKNISIIIK